MISATYKGVTVTFSDAKEEKSAFALLEKLKAWTEVNGGTIATGPMVARSASPSLAGASDGPNLRNWEVKVGARYRHPSFADYLTDAEGKPTPWNRADREGNAGRMLAMLEKGEIVRTVSGWQLTTSNGAPGTPTPSVEDSGEEVL